MSRISLRPTSKLLVLTGAGISAESGVPTFRGNGGLWEGRSVEDVASPEGFAKDPALVWRFYSERRAQLETANANAAHHALVEVEKKLGDRFLLVTQNVDGLHVAAGSQRVLEIHGDLRKTRCSICARPPFADRSLYLKTPLPTCDECAREGRKSLLRVHVVWFGEQLDPGQMERIGRFIHEAGPDLVFLAVGTSGAVSPAAGLVDAARHVGGETWLVNVDPADNGDRFHRVVKGRAGEVLQMLFEYDASF